MFVRTRGSSHDGDVVDEGCFGLEMDVRPSAHRPPPAPFHSGPPHSAVIHAVHVKLPPVERRPNDTPESTFVAFCGHPQGWPIRWVENKYV
eukprot:8211165-Pyramimonas_sp.AAC.1